MAKERGWKKPERVCLLADWFASEGRGRRNESHAQSHTCWATGTGVLLKLAVAGAVAVAGATEPDVAYANTILNAVAIDWSYNGSSTTCKALGGAGQEWITVSQYWTNALIANGVPSGSVTTTQSIRWSYLADPAYGGTDNVSPNWDSKDAAFLGTHGTCAFLPSGCDATDNCSCSSFLKGLTQTTGNPNGDCFHRTSGMMLGDDQAEHSDLNACYSSEPTHWESLTDHTYRLHTWHGAYGLSNTLVKDTLDNFVDDSVDGPTGSAWLIQQTRWDPWGDGFDICAVPLARGNTGEDAEARYYNEKYTSPNWADPTGYYYFASWYCDCYPHHVNDEPIGC